VTVDLSNWDFSGTTSPYGPGASTLSGLDAYASPGDLLSPGYTEATGGQQSFGSGTPLASGGTIGSSAAYQDLLTGAPLNLTLGNATGAVPGATTPAGGPCTSLAGCIEAGINTLLGNGNPYASNMTGGTGATGTPTAASTSTTGCAAWDIGCAIQATFASALSNKTLWIVLGMILLFFVLLRVVKPS